MNRLQIADGRIAVLPDNVRYDGVDHVRVSAPQGRCKICQKNTLCVKNVMFVSILTKEQFVLKCTTLRFKCSSQTSY